MVLLFRRHGPSGRFSGPTLNPFLGFFVSCDEFASGLGRLSAMFVSWNLGV